MTVGPLLTALRQAAVVLSAESRGIDFTFADGTLTLAGATAEAGQSRVELPVALPEILLGINQTILMSLSMIIICAMIGTRDLGQEVFKALAKADAGKGIVAGLCIAFIGMIADRLITAWAARLKA